MPVTRAKRTVRIGGRTQGEPSKYQRRLAQKLGQRRGLFDALAANQRRPYKRPGSQNRKKQ
jgi:hypothetical protein